MRRVAIQYIFFRVPYRPMNKDAHLACPGTASTALVQEPAVCDA